MKHDALSVYRIYPCIAAHMKKLESSWRGGLTTSEVVNLLVDTAGVSAEHSSDEDKTSISSASKQNRPRDGGLHSSRTNTVVDLYRFTSSKILAGNKKNAASGYRMEYFRSPEELTRSI